MLFGYATKTGDGSLQDGARRGTVLCLASYTYDDDNRIQSVTNGAVSEHYTYDGLGRAYQQTTKHNGTDVVTKTAAFQSPEAGKTSAQVVTYTIDAAGYDVTYTYTYDDNGNITSISDGTYTVSYEYDSANQLIRENNQVECYTSTWTYDNAGNILSRTYYIYTTGTLDEPIGPATYTYGDSQWGDLLTACGGTSITYDQIGNMLTDGMRTCTWEHGRQLATLSMHNTTWSYTHNADGLRTKRTNGTDTYNYVYNGSQLTQMTKGADTLYFTYDAGGAPLSVTYNGTIYYYVTNLQGDVIAILNSAGTAVTTYSYDAWGNPLSITGSMASTLGTLNPLLYRGYVYDTETGLYYVSSRYYDPEIGRFINADSQLNQKDGILGYNMFAYCHNNPIMYSDPTGHSITLACIIIGAVIGAVAGGCAGAYVSKKQTGKVNGWAVAAGAVGGGVVGGLVGWGVGAAITAVGATATGSAATAAAPVVQQVAEKASTALQTYYPPNDGFSGAVQKITLEAGTLIQRTGDLVGRYIAPAGTPTQMLSLPYDKIGQPTTILQVQQSVEVLAGRVAPWFGQIGGGIQYQLGTPLDQLISEGIIKIFGG